MDQLLGAQPIPVVLAEEPDARQAAGTFQSIEIVELPLLAAAEVLADVKVAGKPVDSALDVPVHASLAAVLNRFSLEEFLSLVAP